MSNTDDFLAHYGVKGMKWGKRRAERRAQEDADRAGKQEYDRKKLDEVYSESKKKGEKVLVKSRAAGDYADTVMTGKQFVDYVERGGVVDAASTRIFARQAKAGEQFILNAFENEQYVPTRRR